MRLEGLYKTMLGSTICAGQENELLTGAALRAEIIGKLCQEIAISLSFCFFFFAFWLQLATCIICYIWEVF